MPIYDQFPILKTLPIFSAASDAHADRCFADKDLCAIPFRAGEVIYSSANERPSVGVLLSGEAEVHTQGGEPRALLKTASAPALFGIANLYATDAAFPTVVRAKNDVCVLFFDGDAFRSFVENEPAVLQCYLRFLSQKIVYLNRKIATFTAGSAEHRLALFLLENHADGVLTLSHSMTDLAGLLGLGRASLYRAVDRLTELSLIEHRNGSFYLPDLASLAAFSYHA